MLPSTGAKSTNDATLLAYITTIIVRIFENLIAILGLFWNHGHVCTRPGPSTFLHNSVLYQNLQIGLNLLSNFSLVSFPSMIGASFTEVGFTKRMSAMTQPPFPRHLSAQREISQLPQEDGSWLKVQPEQMAFCIVPQASLCLE